MIQQRCATEASVQQYNRSTAVQYNAAVPASPPWLKEEKGKTRDQEGVRT